MYFNPSDVIMMLLSFMFMFAVLALIVYDVFGKQIDFNAFIDRIRGGGQPSDD